MKRSFLSIFLLCLCTVCANAQEATPKKESLCAELIKNPTFEEEAKPIRNRRFGPNGEGELFGGYLPAGIIPGWILNEEDKTTKIEITTDKLLNGQHKALRWEFTEAPSTIANVGNQGIEIIKGNKYRLTFWARADKRHKGKIHVGLQSKSNGTWYAQARVKGKIKKCWKKYTVTFIAEESDPKARFVMTADKPGVIYLDCVSLTMAD